jgi:hypothetical protein
MIRAESFALTTEAFAAQRKGLVQASIDRLRPHVAEALTRIGLPSWERPAVAAALDVFDETARSEVDAWGQVIDDMRDLFQHEMSGALAKTKRVPAEQFEVQVDRLTRWIASMAVNAGTEAATTSDPDTTVGLEWVTMHDDHVRLGHREVAGQVVPTGHPFSVEGEKLMYPGQPVGDPKVWINCRCVCRPTILTEANSKTITASGEAPGLLKDGTPPQCAYCKDTATQYVQHSEGMAYVPACDMHIGAAKDDAAASVPGGEPDPSNIDKVGSYSAEFSADPNEVFTTATIMALPALDDPINGVSSEDIPHVTLIFLGEASAFDPEPIKAVLAAVADGVGSPVTEPINGAATLGQGQADVVLLDAQNLVNVRGAILAAPDVKAVYDSVEQFPTWIPHLTIGWPENPRKDDTSQTEIRFDRIALWYGDDKSAIYHLGGNNVAQPETAPKETAAAVIHAEDAEFTQEHADAFAATAAPEQQVIDSEVPDGEAEQAAAVADEGQPWYGVLAPEGTPSGDGRQFAAGALTNRELPLPIKYMPVDDEGHKGSFVVARMDRIWRENGLIKAEGVFDTSPGALEAARQLSTGMFRGVSVDLDKAVGTMSEDGDSVEFSSGRISSATLCAIPAFAEAFIALGTWADNPDRGVPGEQVIASAPTEALVASAATFADTEIALDADAFRNPELSELTPLTVTEDGRVFGHLAGWETCHIAIPECTTAPSSHTDYAYFLTGQVFTDAGPVAVGQITMGGGHAAGNAGLRAAVSHYDSTSAAVADVTVGEDDHGIWFAGVLREDLSSGEIRALQAASLSGDWRTVRVGGEESYEMVAALAVNVPGFPIPRPRFAMEGGHQLSLVAAGVVPAKVTVDAEAEFEAKMDRYIQRKERAAQLTAMRTEMRSQRVNIIKAEMQTLGGK